MKTKKLLSLLLCVALVLGMIPITATAAYDAEGTTYVRVNSVDELVPNARYIVIGEYEVEGVDTKYFAMSTSTNTYDDIRVGLTETTYTTEDQPNFTMSEDKQTIKLHSGSVMKVRLRAASYGNHEDLYKMEVDGGYLYGFCNSYYYYSTSCCRELKVLTSTRGQTWWRFGMGDNGYWQISTFMRANGNTSITTLEFNDAYGDFMSYCYVNGSGLEPELAFFQNFTEDKDTNILLYREVCTHKSEDLVHGEGVAASCEKGGKREFWFCAGCETYFADEDLTQTMQFVDTYIPAPAHTAGCGHTPSTGRFKLDLEGGASSSNESGVRYLVLGKAGDKYYAMGNVTNADGSRNAVEVTLDENGLLETTSDQAEFLTFDYDNGLFSYLVDGQVLAFDGGKVFTYDKSENNSTDALSRPASFVGTDYESGQGYMYTYDYLDTRNEYLNFDAETLRFEVSRERDETLLFFRELCPHNSLQHVPAKNPTCTEQGIEEYWYCDDENCWNYYQNGDLVNPVDGYPLELWTKMATGHNFAADGVCANCGLARPVYSQVTDLEGFDALYTDASYLIVVKDGEKTYAATLPPINPYYWSDDNGNEIIDCLEKDDNGNGIPDLVENYDGNGDGIDDCLQDLDGDEEVTMWDWDQLRSELEWKFDVETANASNFVEVTMAADGTITLAEEGAAEMLMVPAGLWGGSFYDEEELEMEGIDLTTTRVRALYVPNYWVSSNGYMGSYDEGQFSTWKRTYGDGEAPGSMDGKNWRISFNADGTVNMVSGYEDSSVLRFVKYTNSEGNPDMTIVDMTEWDEEYSDIMLNKTEVLPVYLFASQGVGNGGHTCEFGDWQPDGNTSHTRACQCGETETKDCVFGSWSYNTRDDHKAVCPDCGNTATASHAWNDGVVTQPATTAAAGEMKYTCADCGATKTTVLPKLICTHVWSAWAEVDDNQHMRICTNDGCTAFQRKFHTWDEGAVTQKATESAEGVLTYTCTVCGDTKTESIPMLAHTHRWGQWRYLNDEFHGNTCTGAGCTLTNVQEHTCESWTDNGNGTHTGTCIGCDDAVTKDHIWSDWTENADENVCIRTCICGAEETLRLREMAEKVNVTNTETNDAGAALLDKDLHLISNVLTDEEQTNVAKGDVSVGIYLEVKDVTREEISGLDKEAAEEALQQNPVTEKDTQVGMFLDIGLYKEITTSNERVTETKTTQVKELADKVTISIDIPEELLGDGSAARVYRIVRVHEDADGNLITDIIDGEFDPETKKFTFQTDKFSTYALVYTDRQMGDVDGDGEITAADAASILQDIAGWNVTLQ